ncbi:hypothetical protein HYALB_00013186 [Hymenoscyphus albidus]|uniref:Uncharacterized protein n=1 Tax=Hymenoscyphus albidus TaxID=595503 RepID=A0A9N9QB60_9HELO|nr:hypothetical protein HYALB_00013186 [Hymenoscyphus albidus]
MTNRGRVHHGKPYSCTDNEMDSSSMRETVHRYSPSARTHIGIDPSSMQETERTNELSKLPEMFLLALAALTVLIPVGSALGTVKEWEDFMNNFATDLAPIIVLFGEQVSKQFLSESTSIWDNIIFGMAPLGVITAIVSAIRVYGNASLKAFIGRAQEAHGQAEAKLCSSTSDDVCELWSNGGFCRVFGRPKILEFVHI